MIRTYGKTPYTTAVIHGGPGNPGSLADVAQELATFTGVIEPIQTQYTITELIEELNRQLCSVSQYPFVLLGHSWGAWLAILYAAKYPKMVKQLILVGSGPFEEQFVSQITTRRMSKLSDKERILFKQLLNQLSSNANINKKRAMVELGSLVEKSDNVQIDPDLHNSKHELPTDGVMYSTIWPQAEKIRKNGTLVESLLKIRCPIAIIYMVKKIPILLKALLIPYLKTA